MVSSSNILAKNSNISTSYVLDEDDNVNDGQHSRNDRACKGRRYQEFKDQALGRKGSRIHSRHRSGDRNSLDGNHIFLIWKARPSSLNLEPFYIIFTYVEF